MPDQSYRARYYASATYRRARRRERRARILRRVTLGAYLIFFAGSLAVACAAIFWSL